MLQSCSKHVQLSVAVDRHTYVRQAPCLRPLARQRRNLAVVHATAEAQLQPVAGGGEQGAAATLASSGSGATPPARQLSGRVAVLRATKSATFDVAESGRPLGECLHALHVRRTCTLAPRAVPPCCSIPPCTTLAKPLPSPPCPLPHPHLAAEYMTLPASQYSVLDAKRIERLDADTFRCYVGGLRLLGLEVRWPRGVARVCTGPHSRCTSKTAHAGMAGECRGPATGCRLLLLL